MILDELYKFNQFQIQFYSLGLCIQGSRSYFEIGSAKYTFFLVTLCNFQPPLSVVPGIV